MYTLCIIWMYVLSDFTITSMEKEIIYIFSKCYIERDAPTYVKYVVFQLPTHMKALLFEHPFYIQLLFF
jgi:hypothetical protein